MSTSIQTSTMFKSKRKYSRDALAKVVAESKSVAQVLKSLGLKLCGGNYSFVQKKIKEHTLNVDHFLGQGANSGVDHRGGPTARSADEVLILSDRDVMTSSRVLRKALIEVGVPHRCAECGCEPVWNSKPLQLQVDHINGVKKDNRRENLRFLCPNCHSQTGNWGARNMSRCRPTGRSHHTQNVDSEGSNPFGGTQ